MSIDDSDNDFSSDDDHDKNLLIVTNKQSEVVLNDNDDECSEDELSADDPAQHQPDLNLHEDEDREAEIEGNGEQLRTESINKIDKLHLPKAGESKIDKIIKAKSLKKQKHKTGVIYLSRIPPYMKPAKMRQILSRFGDIDRLFLRREDEQKYKQRTRFGGNKKPMYEEGWAEFIRKRDAKLCAETLNGNVIGGKKGTFYHDDILNVKYLPGFKWADLTEQIARENDIRQSKLEMEISQANKLNSEYIRNVEKSKKLANINRAREKKRTAQSYDNEQSKSEREDLQPELKRQFQQRLVSTNRASAPQEYKSRDDHEISNVIKNLL